MIAIECNACEGAGSFSFPIGRGRIITEACTRCQGKGRVECEREIWSIIGHTHRVLRIKNIEGLASCSERLNIDPIDLDDMERGRKDPEPLIQHIPNSLLPAAILQK